MSGGYAEEAVARFYRTLVTSLEMLLADGTITKDTPVGELLEFCKAPRDEDSS
jgi:hypothetical protein